jgi:hypothetical protein
MDNPEERPDWVKELDEKASTSFPEWTEFFVYQGRPIATTRSFCRERAGRYWHREEIKEWGRNAGFMPWKGMHKGTNEVNIFLLLGGYTCRHILIPVSRGTVPQEDLDRMREKGLIQ